MFPQRDRIFDFPAFWRHSIGTALCAKALAGQLGTNQDSAFTAGLLHDIGRLVLVIGFPQHYEATIACRAERDCGLLEAERHVLGVDHAVAGRALAQLWKFAPAIQEAVADHHEPDEKQHKSLASVVHVADAIAHGLDLSGQKEDLVPLLSSAIWNRMGLVEQEWMEVFKESESQFSEVCRILLA
jgi:putative nucleotidyltransferase with HDIG domain